MGLEMTREAAIFELVEILSRNIEDDSPFGYIRYVLYHGLNGIKEMTNEEIEAQFFAERGQTIKIQG